MPARLQKALVAYVGDIHARAAAAEARATAAAVLARAYAADRLREIVVAKASGDYANLPGTPAELGALLFDVGEADADGVAKSADGRGLLQRFEAILKVADDALGRGSHSADTAAASAAAASSSDAYRQIVGKAHALQDPNLSEAQAINKAATLNPGLVRQWQRDNNAGGGNVRV